MISKKRVQIIAEEIVRKYAGAIFDLDGTILDSLYVWREAGVNYLARCGIAAEENLPEILFNMSVNEGVSYLKRHYALDKSTIEIAAEFNALVESAYRNDVKLKNGALELLRFFKASGIKLCAATAGERIPEEAALKRTGALDCFEKIFTCTEENTSKSFPDIYLKAARYMTLQPENVIVFEDSLKAIRTACTAGFAAAGVFDKESAADWQAVKTVSDYHIIIEDFCKD